MHTRLQKELQEFLIPYHISVESEIFTDVIKKLAHISPSKERRRSFEFDKYSVDETAKTIKFRYGNVTLSDFGSLAGFLEAKMPLIVGEDASLTVTENVLFNKIVPLFKEHVQKLSQEEREQYVIASKPILESMTLQQMKKAATKLTKTLNDIDNYPLKQECAAKIALSQKLFTILSIIDQLEQNPHYYHYLFTQKLSLTNFLHLNPELNEAPDLKPALDLLLEGLENFALYNRSESAIASVVVQKEMKAFLKPFELDTENCDIVPEALLVLAGIKNPPKESYFQRGSDHGRLVFSYKGMNAQDAKTLVDYFKKQGDPTAKEGIGYRQHASFVPETAMIKTMSMDLGPVNPQKPIESHSVEVDAKIFQTRIFNKLRNQITSWAYSDARELGYYRQRVLSNELEIAAISLEEAYRDAADTIQEPSSDELMTPLIAISVLRNLNASQDLAAKYGKVELMIETLKKARDTNSVLREDNELGKRYQNVLTKGSELVALLRTGKVVHSPFDSNKPACMESPRPGIFTLPKSDFKPTVSPKFDGCFKPTPY